MLLFGIICAILVTNLMQFAFVLVVYNGWVSRAFSGCLHRRNFEELVAERSNFAIHTLG